MFKINYDALGIAASVACAIHCAVLPLLMSSLPILGINIINNVFFEYGMILLAAAIGIYSLMHGFKKHHHQYTPIIIFSIGIVLLLLKQAIDSYRLVLLIPAVMLIICAHVINYLNCRKANHCHTNDCTH
jgi:MerC mercury resistance protein